MNAAKIGQIDRMLRKCAEAGRRSKRMSGPLSCWHPVRFRPGKDRRYCRHMRQHIRWWNRYLRACHAINKEFPHA